MPVALHDSQRDTSSTRSGISEGQITITITDQAGQAELTPGQSIEDIIAGLNREVETGRDTSGSLSNNLDEDEINAKFAIASTFVKETATYIKNRGKEVDRAKKALDTEKEKTADERDDALVAQLEQQYKNALIENKTWLPGGTGRKVVNALNAAVGGNLSAGVAQFVQMGVANYLQQEGASLLGRWTREGKLTEGSPLHAALHGAVGCLGAAAGGGDCGAGGMGAATSSLLTNLFTDQPNETFAEKEAKRDIIVGLTTAMALGTDLDPGTAMNSAFSSVDNNFNAVVFGSVSKAAFRGCLMLSSCRTKLVEQFVEVGVKAAVATVVVDQIADNISSEEFDHLFTLMRVGNDEITNQYLSYLQDKYVPTHTGGEQLDGRDSLLTHTGGNQQLESSGAQTHTGNNQPEGQGVVHTGDTDGTTPAIENTTTTPIPDGQTKDDLMYLAEKYQPNQGAVNTMEEFLSQPGFGSMVKGKIQSTSDRYDGQKVFKANSKIGDYIRKNDQIYLDGLHQNHLEVLDARGNFRVVLNLDGTVNPVKTQKAKKEGRRLRK